MRVELYLSKCVLLLRIRKVFVEWLEVDFCHIIIHPLELRTHVKSCHFTFTLIMHTSNRQNQHQLYVEHNMYITWKDTEHQPYKLIHRCKKQQQKYLLFQFTKLLPFFRLIRHRKYITYVFRDTEQWLSYDCFTI